MLSPRTSVILNSDAAAPTVIAHALGVIEFSAAYDLQRERQKQVIDMGSPEALFFCSHPPVITLGTSTREDQVFKSIPSTIAQRGVSIIKTDRGGSITYHGPEQLIAYPILDLRSRIRDVGIYLRNLEQIVILTLEGLGIPAMRLPGKTGVWLNDHDKICSMGVRLSRWVSMHGLALNVASCAEINADIFPCGIPEARLVSIEEATGQPANRESIIADFVRHFSHVFESSVVWE